MEPRDYGPFPYTPINDRPKLEWPGGARLAVWVIPNIEFFPLTRRHRRPSPSDSRAGNPPSVRAWAQRDYGNRVGIWRIMDVLRSTGSAPARPSTATSATITRRSCAPRSNSAGRSSATTRPTASGSTSWSPDEERQTIARTLSRIAEMTGKKPVGWLGSGLAETWHTLDYPGRGGLSLRRRLGQ